MNFYKFIFYTFKGFKVKIKYKRPAIFFLAGGRRTLNVSTDDGEFTVEKLVEDDDYEVTVQEIFFGLGPKTKRETFTTARFSKFFERMQFPRILLLFSEALTL